MPNASEIYEQLASFLANEKPLNDFNEWLVRYTWNDYLEGDLKTRRLTGSIELAIAEYGNGHLSKDEFRSKLFDLLKTRDVLVPSNVTTVTRR